MKVMKARFWIDTLALTSAIACALALLLAILAAAGRAVAREPESAHPAQPAPDVQLQSYEGIITDTHCGAKHSAAVGMAAADCTRVCVHSGERFALVDGDKTYTLEGESAALKRVAGQRVKVTGTLNGNTIAVASVASV